MLYRVVRSVHRGYALTIFWIYLGAFAVAFCFMFILPLVTISLVFAAIFGLAAAYCGELVLGGLEHLLVRRFLRRNICPTCRAEGLVRAASDHPGDAERSARIACTRCGGIFEPSGVELEDETTGPVAA